MRNIDISLLLMLTFFSGCQRGADTAPKEDDLPCKIRTMTTGTIRDEIIYTYTYDSENRAIKRLNFTSLGGVGMDLYEYTGDQLSVIRSYGDTINQHWNEMQVFERKGNEISQSIFKYHYGKEHQQVRYIYKLDGNGLLRSRDEYYSSDTAAPLQLAGHADYEVDANNNILVERDYWYNELKTTWVYTYDDKRNWRLTLPESTILVAGKNNIKSLYKTDKDGKPLDQYTVSYEYDLNHFPAHALTDGIISDQFTYQCDE